MDVAKPAKKRSHGKNLNLYDKFQKNGSRPLSLEFDYSSNQFRAIGENYQLFVRLVSNEVDRHAPFHYRSWQEVPGEIKMSILTTLHYWEGIKQGIQSDCANRYKDRKTKLKKHFDKVGGYDNTERANTKPLESMNPDAWVRVIEELFTTLTYQKWSQANSANCSKQLYESYHGTQSYAQRRYTKVQETGVAKHVEGWRDMHCKGSSGWHNELAGTHWGKIMDEKNKSMSSSGGDDMPVNEVEILERSLGQRRGYIRGVGRTVKSVTPDVAPSMSYTPHNQDLHD
ncbi:hypothetical protein R6Q59_027674 [Mikania micrantha]